MASGSGKKPKEKAGSNWPIIREQIKYIDLLIEVCDARAPQSSRHGKAHEMFAGKVFLVLLNKADLADKNILSLYLNKLNQSTNQKAIAISLKQSTGKKAVMNLIYSLTASRRERQAKKGIRQKITRICVIGLPNVGKSSLINWLGGRKRAKAADRPGITRGPQWIRLDSQLEMLDTPGILPKDHLGRQTRDKLAILNLIGDGSEEVEGLANKALAFLKTHYLMAIKNYLAANHVEEITLERLARKRNFLNPGGKYDLMRAATTLLSDLRSGKLGGVCLDLDLLDKPSSIE